MNFDFSEEQVMLRDSVARFIQDDYDWDARKAIAATDEGMSKTNWQTFADLGWLSVPFEEEYGGFGGSAVDVMLLMEQFGKGLVLEPYLATVILFGGLVQKGGSEEQKSKILPKVIDGSLQGAFAYVERQSRHELADVKTSATSAGDGYSLTGEKVVVFNGANADHLVVSARTSGDQCDQQGISLFLVDANSSGVARTSYRMMDGQVVANITLDNAQGELVGTLDDGYPLIEQTARDGNLAVCSEAMGIMEKLNATTLEYTKTREQFGVAIGSFQALQHRMVDTMLSYEQTRSIIFRALCALTNGEEDATTAVHAMKVVIDRHGKKVFEEAIQLHGGMGLTDEMDIGHYAKRMMMINTSFGDGDFHQQKYNELVYG